MDTENLENQLEQLTSEVRDVYSLLETLVEESRKQTKLLDGIYGSTRNVESDISTIAMNS